VVPPKESCWGLRRCDDRRRKSGDVPRVCELAVLQEPIGTGLVRKLGVCGWKSWEDSGGDQSILFGTESGVEWCFVVVVVEEERSAVTCLRDLGPQGYFPWIWPAKFTCCVP
jgi:hypothetical protein